MFFPLLFHHFFIHNAVYIFKYATAAYNKANKQAPIPERFLKWKNPHRE